MAKNEKAKTAKGKTEKKKTSVRPAKGPVATLISSKVVYTGPLFRVLHDKIVEPGGFESERDVIRHNGSVVILALDTSKSKKNPLVVLERQYRHAANQFLWELPAGKLEGGEEAIEGAKRELAEETGFRSKKWKPLVEYYASPGFLGEAFKVFVAEGLEAGETSPDDDEKIELKMVKLSELLEMIEKGAIHDGKTICSVLLYDWLSRHRTRKK
jgi:ADP-ribose pyrophosphatase